MFFAEMPVWLPPLLTAFMGAAATAFAAWMGYFDKRKETLEQVAERMTLAQLERMQKDIDMLRGRVTECEAEIKHCEATIREMQTRGHRWYRWAHELMAYTLDARARAHPPEDGWPPLPEMPNKFDLDNIAA
jgi:hypothetical protein